MSGLWLWVWYWRPQYVELARQIGACGLLIKAADGTRPWSQWVGAAEATRSAGLQAVPWAYNYGDPAEINALVSLDEPIICLDPEADFEAAAPEARQRFVARLREARDAGTRVWIAVESRPALHPGIPYKDFDDVAEAMIPMVAWQVWAPRSVTHWLDDWDFFDADGFPWLPAGNVTPDELVASVREAIARYGAASIWEASILTPEQVAALSAQGAAA